MMIICMYLVGRCWKHHYLAANATSTLQRFKSDCAKGAACWISEKDDKPNNNQKTKASPCNVLISMCVEEFGADGMDAWTFWNHEEMMI